MVKELSQVLNWQAWKMDWLGLSGLSLFGAEDEDKEEEEEEDSDPDTDSPDEEEEEDEGDGTKSFAPSYVKKLRREAAETRKKLRDAQAALDKVNQQNLSEKEKAEQRAKAAEDKAAKLEGELTRVLIDRRVESMARELKFRDPSDARAMLDLTDLETDEDDIPTRKAIRKALSDLASKKSYLVSAEGSGDGGSGGPNPRTDRRKEREEELVKTGRVRIGR